MAIKTSSATGNASDGTKWVGGVAPTTGDQIIVAAGHTITQDVDATYGISLCTTQLAKPTVSATGTGGSLPAGAYKVKIASVGTGGATSASAETSNVTITAGQKVRVVLPTLPAGATSWNVYLTNTAGAAGTERLYATGQVAGNFDCTSASWMDGTVAYASATGLPNGDAIQVTGNYIVPSGITVTAKGNVVHTGDVTYNSGGIEFDPTSSPGGAAIYAHVTGSPSTQGSGKIIMRGSSGARPFIRTKSGQTPAWITNGPQTSTSGNVRLDCEWARFSRLGNGTSYDAINCVCAAAYNQLLTDVIFDADCSTLTMTAVPATGGWIFNRVAFNQTSGMAYGGRTNVCVSFGLATNADVTTGSRSCTRVGFNVLPPALSAGGSSYDYCYFNDVWGLLSAGPAGTTGSNFTMTNCFIRKLLVGAGSGVDSAELRGNGSDNYFYLDNITGPTTSDLNPHGFSTPAGGTGTTRTWERNCIEYNGSSNSGDMFKTPGSSIGIFELKYNIVVPNGAGLSSGTIYTFPNSTTSNYQLKVENNTYIGGPYSLSTSEGGPMGAGVIASLRSNLVYSPDQTTLNRYVMGKADGDGSTDTIDIANPANVSNNAGWNLLTRTGAYSGGYSFYNTRFSSAPGAGDVDLGDGSGTPSSAGPQFVDWTRNFLNWAVTVVGATGTNSQKIAAGLAAMKAYCDTTDANYNAAYTTKAPSTWVRAGFRPQNSLLDGAGYGGTDIGAMDVLLGPPVAGTVSLGSITSTSITASMTAPTGGTQPYSYQLKRAPDVAGSPGTFANVGSAVTGQTSSYTFPADTGLSSATDYWYEVVITDAAAQSVTTTPVKGTTSAAAPALASGTLTKTGQDSDSIDFAITAATGGTGPYEYKLYRHTGSFTPPGTGTLIETSSDLTMIDTAPTVDVFYTYRVLTTDAVAATVLSNEVTAAILSTPATGGSPIFVNTLNRGSKVLGDVLYLFKSAQTSLGEITDTDAAPTFRVYKNITETPVYTGTMTLFDDTNTTGVYAYQLFLTAENGFEEGAYYHVLFSGLLDGKTGYSLDTFQIGIPSPTTDSPGITTLLARLTAPRATSLDNLPVLAGNVPTIIMGIGSGVYIVASLDPDAITAIQNGLTTTDDLTALGNVIDQTISDLADDELGTLQDDSTAIRTTTDQLAQMIEADGPDFRFDANALELAPVTESIDIDEAAIAQAVNTLLSAEHGDGDWDAVGSGGGSATGENTVTILARDSVTLVGLPGIRITVRDDSGTLVDQKTTGYGGYAVFALDDGNYTLSSLPRLGYSSVASQAFTVDGDESVTVNLIAITATPLTGDAAKYIRTVEFYIYDEDRSVPVVGATVKAELLDANPAVPNVLLAGNSLETTTNLSGYASLNLVMSDKFSNGNGRYRITYDGRVVDVKIPYGKKTAINIEKVITGQEKLGEI